MKLLYDVLRFSPKDIDRAVLFATNNALVCETPEDANKVAYEMDKKARYDVSNLQIRCVELLLNCSEKKYLQFRVTKCNVLHIIL